MSKMKPPLKFNWKVKKKLLGKGEEPDQKYDTL